MARTQTNLYLSDETRAKLNTLVTVTRKTTGRETSMSTVVTALVAQAVIQLKRIEPIRDGKRTTGWRAFYGDHYVGDFDLMDKAGAELALDRFAYEELSK